MALSKWTIEDYYKYKANVPYYRRRAEQQAARRKALVGVSVRGTRFAQDLKNIKHEEWDSHKELRLRWALGLAGDLWRQALLTMSGKQWPRRRVCTRAQRLTFLKHWHKQVLKRQWYRWEAIDFTL